ncbi:uncharacterized protein LOC116209146 [Punica granatum]|uniref:Uncharacterized protein LOC116209146 n=1 Tax=Punica granatum TaxID=22663 RepID=A0A6P8DMJ9_PUNGR|nr:uncharacterized protein LOC116209146 [Punica granatum]
MRKAFDYEGVVAVDSRWKRALQVAESSQGTEMINIPVNAPSVKVEPENHCSQIANAGPENNWARKLFGGAEQEVKHHWPQIIEGRKFVKPPKAVFEAGATRWRNALVGQIVGKKIQLSQIYSTVNYLWGQRDGVKVFELENGLILFDFTNTAQRDWVLHCGPWQIHHCPLILRPWKKDFPMWVTFSKVPLELMTHQGLCYVASAVGRPLSLGNSEVKMSVANSTVVCVEVDVQEELHARVEVMMHDEQSVKIHVEYPRIKEGSDLRRPATKKWIRKEMSNSGERNEGNNRKTKQNAEDDMDKSPVKILTSVYPVHKQFSVVDNNVACPKNVKSPEKRRDRQESSSEGYFAPKEARPAVPGFNEVTQNIKRGQRRGKKVDGVAKGQATGPDWVLIHNYSQHALGRIWILADISINVSVVKRTEQCIHCGIHSKVSSARFWLIVVYAANTIAPREALWSSRKGMSNLVVSSSWIVVGDFNVVKETTEASNSDDSDLSGMLSFWKMLEDTDLHDHKWLVEFLAPLLADHSPGLTTVLLQKPETRRSFKFFNFWTEHPKNEELVGKCWTVRVQGNPMFVLYKKLKLLRMVLKGFNKQYYWDNSKRVIDARIQLEEKARIEWLSLGDSNIGLFHKAVKIISARNTLKQMVTEDGRLLTDVRDIASDAVTFYQKLLGSKDFSVDSSVEELRTFLSYRLNEAHKLQCVLPDFIVPDQSAFVKRRCVGDNILMAHELVKGYQREGISPRCAIKADVMEAFGSVNWDFVRNIFKVIEVPDKFSSWVMECISGAYFSVNVNGGMEGYFKGFKGLRQGEPDSLKSIMEIFDRFYKMSGLKFNPAKSEILCGGIKREVVQKMLQISQFKLGTLPVQYLGVPLIPRRLTYNDCRPLIEKITQRIDNWASKKLSYAGRLQLIQSVVHSLVKFWCSAFILPKKVIRAVEQKCKAYLWRGKDGYARGSNVKGD